MLQVTGLGPFTIGTLLATGWSKSKSIPSGE